MISDYEAQLAAATAGRKELGGVVQVAFFDRQVRALAALGDTSRLRQKVDSFIAAWNPALGERLKRNIELAPTRRNFTSSLRSSCRRTACLERRWPLRTLVSRGMRRARASPMKHQRFSAIARRIADVRGRLDPAPSIWAKLAASDTLYTGARIQLAIIAARQGDSVSALQTMQVLDSLSARPYAFGGPLVREGASPPGSGAKTRRSASYSGRWTQGRRST